MIKAVIFDMDGTILDTLEDLRSSVNHALRQYGFPERSSEEVRQFLGNGMVKLIERAVRMNDWWQVVKSEKLSNGSTTVYIDGYKASLIRNRTPVKGNVYMGKDKHGNVWVANMSDYRLDVTFYWTYRIGQYKVNGNLSKPDDTKSELMDPWEIYMLKNSKGEYLLKDLDSSHFKITRIFEHL